MSGRVVARRVNVYAAMVAIVEAGVVVAGADVILAVIAVQVE